MHSTETKRSCERPHKLINNSRFCAGRRLPTYLQRLRQRPSTDSVQLAGSALLHFLFLLLHALQASHQHLHSTQPHAQAGTNTSSTKSKTGTNNSSTSGKHEQQPPLPDLSDNAIGDVTCADAQWCPVSVTLRRIGKAMLCCLLVFVQ